MDTVVYLALSVLASVFLVSFIVLIIMCRRRRFRLKHLTGNPRFSKLENENMDSLVQLTPLLASALERNGWVYDVGGLLQHCVAVLQLAHSLTEQLQVSSVAMINSSPQLQEIVCDATHRIMPRFDDLLASVASPKVDVRILEARAMALATVCWSLILPFTLSNPGIKEKLAEQLKSMDSHLEALQAAARLAERSETGQVEVDWSQMPAEGDGGDDGEASASTEPHEGGVEEGGADGAETRSGGGGGASPGPASSTSPASSRPVLNGTVTPSSANSGPSQLIFCTTIAETVPLLEELEMQLRDSSIASPNGHPADPRV